MCDKIKVNRRKDNHVIKHDDMHLYDFNKMYVNFIIHEREKKNTDGKCIDK